jgi:peptidoglycan/xylan/chitin deacetylase (PgdA/CDA1 family)
MKAILTYHSVDDSASVISISPAAFRRQMEFLARHGPPVLAVDELLRLPPASAGVAITFDDAYTNFADTAWPVLRDLDMPVTVFVPVDCIGGRNSWDDGRAVATPQLEIMNWAVLGRVADEGTTLGSHTCTHSRLTRLSAVAVVDELEHSRDALERETGRRPAGLAYPYGDVNDVVATAAAAVYDFACSTELRPLREAERRHMLPRLDTYYLRRGDALAGWGTLRMRVYLEARARARRFRHRFLGRGD